MRCAAVPAGSRGGCTRRSAGNAAYRPSERPTAFFEVAHRPPDRPTARPFEAATYPGNLRDLREAVIRASLHARAEDTDEVRLEHRRRIGISHSSSSVAAITPLSSESCRGR